MKKKILTMLSVAVLAVTTLLGAVPASAAPAMLTVKNQVEVDGAEAGKKETIPINGAQISVYRIGSLSGETAFSPDAAFASLGTTIPTDSAAIRTFAEAAAQIITDQKIAPFVYNDDATMIAQGLSGDGKEDGDGTITFVVDDGAVYIVMETAHSVNSVEYEAFTPILLTVPEGEMETVTAIKYELSKPSTPETPGRKVLVKKVWAGDDEIADERPEIEVVLQDSSGSEVVVADSTVTLSEENGWTYTWSDLDYYAEDGETVLTYKVVEKDVPDGYEAKVTNIAASDLPEDVAEGYGFLITNSYTPTPTPTPTVTPTPTTTPTVTPGTTTTTTRTPVTTRIRNATTKGGTATRVKTGDTNNLILWGVIAAAAVVLLIVVIAMKKRRKMDR